MNIINFKPKKIILNTFTIVCIFGMSLKVNAQFMTDGVIPNRYARTITSGGNTPVGVGIGNFDNSLGRNPSAALHVNTNFLPTTSLFTPGEVFRTDAPAGNVTFWRMQQV